MYIDRAIKFEVLEIDICEGNWWLVMVRISDRNYKGTLILVYHSPSGSDAKFLDFMEEMCNRDITEGNVIIMGDFNINMKDKNYCQKKLLRTMNTAGLKQMVKEPTRIVYGSESIIDLVFTNYEVEVIVKHEPKITDHSTIVIDWKIKLTDKEDKFIVCRDYKRMDVDKFMRVIDMGMNVIEYEEVDMLANAIVNTIIWGIDEVAPRRQIKLHGKWKGKQWCTEDIRLMLRQRDKAYSKARISKNEEDWKSFSQIRNRIVQVCRVAKREYLESMLDKNKNDPKRMWGSLKELLKGKTYDDSIYEEIQCGDKIYRNVNEMANIFNKYFIDSIGELLDDGVSEVNEVIVGKYTESELEVFNRIEVEDLNRIVQKLKNKSGTEEGITVDIMKKVVIVAGTKIVHMLNRSLEEGMFPSEWKQATVIPIPKIKRTKKVNEFRPINKLPIYEKILEIIVHKQMVRYLEDNKLLIESQSGFREGHSCETALQWVISSWKKSIGENKIVGVVFIDLRRAFELVNRNILLQKLERYGLKGVVIKWFKSYLNNRTQRVKFNGMLSDPIDVKVGVPQGSVLGPLLFLFYINDIINELNEKCEIRLFADDMLIYTTGYSTAEISNNLNEQLVRVENWLKINKLKVNVDKTKVMLMRGIRKKVNQNNLKIKLENIELEVVNEIKYLGVIIDKNLNFMEHVNYIGKKIGSKLGVLRRVGVNLTPYMRCVVYKSIVAPLFEYCSTVFLSVNETNLQYLQKLQNKGMRIILRCNYRARIKDMLEALQFMSVKERIEYNVCILVYKMINGQCPNYLVNRVEIMGKEMESKTRQRGNIYITKCKTREEQRTLLHDGFKMYNELPNEIKTERGLLGFKRAVAAYLGRRE